MLEGRPMLKFNGHDYVCVDTDQLPFELAQLFSRMDAREQAEFFDYLATCIGRWDKNPAFQWSDMTDVMSRNAKQCLASMAEELK